MIAGLGSTVSNRTIRIVLIAVAAGACAFAQQPTATPPLPVQAQPETRQITIEQRSTPPAPGSQPDGAAIFQERCSKCHGDHGQGISVPSGIAGPALLAVHDPGDVLSAMEIGPSHMPRFAYVLSVPEMEAVANYVTQHLATIPPMQGDLGEGGELFRAYCAPCHRTAVRGGVMVFTGVNAPDISDKSPAVVAGAIRWGPGPMPAFPPSVLNDKELWSIVDYIKVAQHPPSPGGSALHWDGPVAEGFVAWVTLFILIVVVGWIERGGKG